MVKFFFGDLKSAFLSIAIFFLGAVILLPSIIGETTASGLIIFIVCLVALLFAHHFERKELEKEQDDDIVKTFE